MDHTIINMVAVPRGVSAADVDGDGDIDALSASLGDDKIAWYENDGNGAFTPHTISTTADGARSVSTADLDGDGDLDVLSASFLDDKIAWYENNGSEVFIEHTIDTTADGARFVTTSDLDGDGDLDVLSTSAIGNTVDWYKNDGNQNFTKLPIAAGVDGPIEVTTVDIDGDGDLDPIYIAATGNTSALSFTTAVFETTLDNTPTFIEGGTAVVLDSDVSIYDAELTSADNFDGSTINITRDGGAIADDEFSHSGLLGPLIAGCLLYTSPSPRDGLLSRMPSSA